MSERYSTGGDPGLERLLAEMDVARVFPPTPDIAATMRVRIGARDEQPAGWRDLIPQPGRRQLALVAVIVLLLGVGLLTIVPGVRTAVADWIGVGGIRIEWVQDEPDTDRSPVGATLLLGEAMTLNEAQARVPYVIAVPAALGQPDEVYVRQLSGGPMVSLLYLPRPDLPAAAETGVGAILMQFPADAHPAELSKRVSMGMARVTEVDVGDSMGYWVTGVAEFVIAEDPSASFDDEPSRPSANVLIWQVGDVTYRLETDLIHRQAVAIAESLVPSGGSKGTDSTP